MQCLAQNNARRSEWWYQKPGHEKMHGPFPTEAIFKWFGPEAPAKQIKFGRSLNVRELRLAFSLSAASVRALAYRTVIRLPRLYAIHVCDAWSAHCAPMLKERPGAGLIRKCKLAQKLAQSTQFATFGFDVELAHALINLSKKPLRLRISPNSAYAS